MNKIAKQFKTLLTVILAVVSFAAHGQLWVPMEDGVSNTPLGITADSDNIYVAYDVVGAATPTIKVAKWNGIFWAELPALEYSSSTGLFNNISLKFYQNELYLASSFESISGVPFSIGIVKFDGTQWVSVGNGVGNLGRMEIKDLEIYDGELYLAGYYLVQNSEVVSSVSKWDGTNWSKLGESGKVGVDEGTTDLLVHNSTLYVSGAYKENGDTSALALGTWQSGSGWTSGIDQLPPQFPIVKLASFGGDLFAVGLNPANPIMRWDDNTWANASNGIDQVNSATLSFVEYQGNLWLAGSFEINGKNYQLIEWDGTTWTPLPEALQLDISLLDEVGADNIYAVGTFIGYDDYALNHVANFMNNISRVAGIAYHDTNLNCKFDIGEQAIPGVMVELQGGVEYAQTDIFGRYQFFITPGSYDLRLVDNPSWKATSCGNDAFSVILSPGDNSGDHDISLQKNLSINDDASIKVYGARGWKARQGFTEGYAITYENLGSTTITSGTVTLTHDPGLNFISANPAPNSYSNAEATWSFLDLQPGEKRTIRMEMQIPLSVPILSKIVFQAGIDIDVNDANPGNNTFKLEQEVRAAFDPNDKQSFPEGDIQKDTEVLDYTIRFQNTGTDTAFRVTVVDTVDTNLPLTGIYIGSRSHTFQPNVVRDNNVLVFVFDNIMLPDSGTDMAGSQGYINLSARLRPGVSVGTEITNEAFIYFDYQKPIKTNLTKNKMVDIDVGIPTIDNQHLFKVYPNPVTDVLTIAYDGYLEKPVHLQLTNLLGQVVSADHLLKGISSSVTLHLQSLPAGVYFLKDEQGFFIEKVVVK